MIYYFAYGMLTNKSFFPEDKLISTGILKGYGFELFQHANIREDKDKIVHGAVWEISEEKLSYLDFIEGYPQYYNRKLVDVEVNGRIIKTYVYLMTDESRESCLYTTPNSSYVKTMIEGYNQCGIDISQLYNELNFI